MQFWACDSSAWQSSADILIGIKSKLWGMAHSVLSDLPHDGTSSFTFSPFSSPHPTCSKYLAASGACQTLSHFSAFAQAVSSTLAHFFLPSFPDSLPLSSKVKGSIPVSDSSGGMGYHFYIYSWNALPWPPPLSYFTVMIPLLMWLLSRVPKQGGSQSIGSEQNPALSFNSCETSEAINLISAPLFLHLYNELHPATKLLWRLSRPIYTECWK